MIDKLQVEQSGDWHVTTDNTQVIFEPKLTKNQAHLVAIIVSKDSEYKQKLDKCDSWDRHIVTIFCKNSRLASVNWCYGDKYPDIHPIIQMDYNKVYNSLRPKFLTTNTIFTTVTLISVILSSILTSYFSSNNTEIKGLQTRIEYLEKVSLRGP